MTRTLHTAVKSGERLVATDITDLTFFPKGTILMFSSEAWNAASTTFKTIWKICDGTYNTPNLVNKFLRGGTTSGTTGGADSQNITLSITNIPRHNHTYRVQAYLDDYNMTGIHAAAGADMSNNQTEWLTDIATSYTGGNTSNNTDAFTVNTVPCYHTVIYIMKVA